MMKSNTCSYKECIETAAKLELIEHALESMEDAFEWILVDEEYEPIVEAQNLIRATSKMIRRRALSGVTEKP